MGLVNLWALSPPFIAVTSALLFPLLVIIYYLWYDSGSHA